MRLANTEHPIRYRQAWAPFSLASLRLPGMLPTLSILFSDPTTGEVLVKYGTRCACVPVYNRKDFSYDVLRNHGEVQNYGCEIYNGFCILYV